MKSHLNTFKNLKILVLGFASSGYSISNYLVNKGASVSIYASAFGDSKKVAELKHKGARFHSNTIDLNISNENFDIVVKSPGIPYSNPLIQAASGLGIPIYTDIELLHTDFPRTIGITGTNGKTTTTTLIELMLKTTFPHSYACGNIGRPVAEVLLDEKTVSNLVMELSSFQLEGTFTFRPSISVLLNITPAHLDFHEDFNDYINAKAKITKNQKETDFIVYNIENPLVKNIAETSLAIGIPFSVNSFHQKGACVQDGWIYYEGEKFLPLSEVFLVGKHNLENVLASIIVSKISGVPNKNIIQILKTFSGVEHRLQYIGQLDGRTYYNDSKATNSLATKNAVSSFTDKPILIAGGLNRGNDFEDLIEVFQNCKYVFLIGETSNIMLNIAKKHGLINVLLSHDLPRAVTQIKAISSIGDTILLSPACASWDQYPSFEKRGEHFIDLVTGNNNFAKYFKKN